jgi:hypothetical protein
MSDLKKRLSACLGRKVNLNHDKSYALMLELLEVAEYWKKDSEKAFDEGVQMTLKELKESVKKRYGK